MNRALAFVETLRGQPNCVLVSPGPRHWEIFRELCERAGAKGNLVADAYHAATAIEHGCEWITTDRDYARFPGLRWRHPLA
jgi:toxin-antitoxin system PIN domain toxin